MRWRNENEEKSLKNFQDCMDNWTTLYIILSTTGWYSELTVCIPEPDLGTPPRGGADLSDHVVVRPPAASSGPDQPEQSATAPRRPRTDISVALGNCDHHRWASRDRYGRTCGSRCRHGPSVGVWWALRGGGGRGV